jgi:RNA polymerase sigma-70 factor (ECF subfamily)
MTADADDFAALFSRVRAGDPAATAEFVRAYEPQLRRKVRNWLHLQHPYLRSVLDSVDVCQSVLASFLLRVGLGQYDLERPEDVWNLLVVMSRHCVQRHARSQLADCRDARRREARGAEVLEALTQGPSPSREATARDLLRAVRERLTAEEWSVAERRVEGRSWAEVAAALGGTADARRMQLSRALDRVSRELGLEEEAADG